jgi:hypothetical protein
VQNGYKEFFAGQERSTVVESGRIASSELATAEEMARMELKCDKKTSRVSYNGSETVINSLPGYG